MFFSVGYLFLVGGFINFPLVERVSKAKQLQLMTGLKPYTYWFSSYLWDFLLYFIVTFIVVFFVIGLFDSTSTFNGSYELITLFSILILYGLSSILYSYFVSFFRGTVPGAFSFLLISSIIIGKYFMFFFYVCVSFALIIMLCLNESNNRSSTRKVSKCNRAIRQTYSKPFFI